jgi:hypothetical protein
VRIRMPQVLAIQKTTLANFIVRPLDRRINWEGKPRGLPLSSRGSAGYWSNSGYYRRWNNLAQRFSAAYVGKIGTSPGGTASAHHTYSPPTVSPSTRIVGAATDPRNSRSLAISEILKNNSFKFPATVISSTGYANSPPEIHIPEAPRE